MHILAYIHVIIIHIHVYKENNICIDTHTDLIIHVCVYICIFLATEQLNF